MRECHYRETNLRDIQEQPNVGGFESNPQLPTAIAIQEAGGAARYVQCDVTHQAQVTQLVRQTVELYGGLDVMVNNAGIYRSGKFAHEFSVEDLDARWNVNLKGTWFGAQEAIKVFLDSRGEAATSSTLFRRPAFRGIRNRRSTTSPKGQRPT